MRKRFWLIALDPKQWRGRGRSLETHLQDIWATVNSLKSSPEERAALEDLLLADNDPHIDAVLADKESITEESSPTTCSWPQHHFQYAQQGKCDMQDLYPNGASKHLDENRWYKCLPGREKPICCFVNNVLMQNEKDIAEKGFPNCANISQSLGRCPVGRNNVVPTILCGSTLWHTRRQRVISGHELMHVQGLAA